MGILDDYLDPDRHLWPPEPPDGYDEAWEAINTLYCQPKDNRDEAAIKNGVYKYTDCGAWIEFEEGGVRLGSIVEGSDVGCQTYFIRWNQVTVQSITERLDAIEKEAAAIWEWANTIREDGQTDAEHGVDCPDVGWDFKHLQ